MDNLHPWVKFATKRGPRFEVLDRVRCTMADTPEPCTVKRIILTNNGWSYVVRYDHGAIDTWAEILLASVS